MVLSAAKKKEKGNRERFEKLVVQLKQISAAATDAHLELQAILDTRPSESQNAKTFLDEFVTTWQKKYPGQKYVVNGAKDIGSIKRLLKSLTIGELRQRRTAFFTSTDPFFKDAHHPLGLFCGAINKLGGDRERDDIDAPVIGCTHSPACTSDQQHTQRKIAESKRR